MNTPITLTEAADFLREALVRGDEEAIKKWDYIIRSINDYRVLNKQREREHMNLLRRAQLKRERSNLK